MRFKFKGGDRTVQFDVLTDKRRGKKEGKKGGWKIVYGYSMFVHFWCFVSIPFRSIYCRSVWWERWRASFHSAHHSRDQQDIRPFLLNWQKVENLQDISSLYKGQRSLLAWEVPMNTLCRHGNTIINHSHGIPSLLGSHHHGNHHHGSHHYGSSLFSLIIEPRVHKNGRLEYECVTM